MTYTGSAARQLTPEATPHLKLIEGGLLYGEVADPRASGVQKRAPRARKATAREPQSRVASIAFFALATMLVVGLAIFSGMSEDAMSRSSAAYIEDLPRAVVVVHAGDSLWELAEGQNIEGASTRDIVECIQRENGLGPEALQPGQRIIVPVAG